MSAAGAVPVSAGTGTHTDLSAGTAPDQGIAELSCLAGDKRIHCLQFFFRDLMRRAVLTEMFRKEIPQDMFLTAVFMQERFQKALCIFRGKVLFRPLEE